MNAKNAIRTNIKTMINIFEICTKWIPFGKTDVLIIYDFDKYHEYLTVELGNLKVKTIKYNQSKVLRTCFWVSRAKVIYVDNMNIVISSMKNIDGKVVQYWHATSAIKKFGLATIEEEKEFETRKAEFQNYDIVTVNSEYMADKFTKGFGFNDQNLYRVGCVQSKDLFECPMIKPYFEYIVYVPTFRWDSKNDKQAIEFIKNFKSSSYKLIYSLHPKLDIKIENDDAIDVTGTDIRSYFKYASLVISDYSSLLIDASLLCPYTAMYAYDFLEYYIDPGLYITSDNYWGFYTESEEELLAYIQTGNFITHDLDIIHEKFFTYDDKNSVKRIANIAREAVAVNKKK